MPMVGSDVTGADPPAWHSSDGLKWATPKSDRMPTTMGAVTVRYLIKESLKQQRGGREYIHAKPYVRIVGHLAPVPQNYATLIPSFNPLKLYNDEPTAPSRPQRQALPTRASSRSTWSSFWAAFCPSRTIRRWKTPRSSSTSAAAKEAEAEAEKIREGAEADANRWRR